MPSRYIAALHAVESIEVKDEKIRVLSEEVCAKCSGQHSCIPVENIVAVCVADRPNQRVCIDAAVWGRLILATTEWAIIMPAGRKVPVVVETSHVTFHDGHQTDAA